MAALSRRTGIGLAQSLDDEIATRAIALGRMVFKVSLHGDERSSPGIFWRIGIALGNAEQTAIPPRPDIVDVRERNLACRRPLHQAKQLVAIIFGERKARCSQKQQQNPFVHGPSRCATLETYILRPSGVQSTAKVVKMEINASLEASGPSANKIQRTQHINQQGRMHCADKSYRRTPVIAEQKSKGRNKASGTTRSSSAGSRESRASI